MVRTREVKAGLAILVSALLAIVFDAGAAGAVTEPDTVNEPAPGQYLALDLAHPVSVRDVLAEASTVGVDVRELRLAGNGLVGGLIPRPGAAPASQQAWVEQAFHRRFQATPAVTHVVLDATTSASDARTLVTRLTAAAEEVPTSTASVPPRPASATTTARVNGQDVDEHFPSIWEGDTYRTHYPDGQTLRAYDNWFVYESAYGAQPWSFPADWGMEIGITTYSTGQVGIRPFCQASADTDFWSSTYNLGGLWGTNVNASAAPYADYAIISDSCGANSAELGIGFPAQLAVDTAYLIFTELYPGTRSLSEMSASMSMQSNDCNDLGRAPHTDCMGLNVPRTPPGGFDKSQLLVNKDRRWSVSGCFVMADGFDAPLRYYSGSPNCPGDVYY